LFYLHLYRFHNATSSIAIQSSKASNPYSPPFTGFSIKINWLGGKAQHTLYPFENEQETEEQHSDGYNIISKENDSWSNFEYALREESRLLFNKMLSKCKENEDIVRAANSKDEYFSAESLFMILILQQQKTINELISKVAEQKKEAQVH
jgi:hypothetical protein